MDREITLRDYGRVLWSGRWLILTAAVVAVLVGLALTLVTTTKYVARSQVYTGQVTTPNGALVSTPGTNPGTAPIVLRGDDIVARVAKKLGVRPSRVRDGVSLSAPRTTGANAANQPTLLTIEFTDRSRDIARDGVNAYADEILATAKQRSAQALDDYEDAVATGEAEVARIKRKLETWEQQLLGAPAGDQATALQTLILSASDQLGSAQEDLTVQRQNLLAEREYGQPEILTRAQNPRSTKDFSNRARTLLLALAIGLIVGAVVTFIWKGSPAGRAAPG